MQPLHYAVVAYVRNPVGRFVEDLRHEVYPEYAHLPAHLTLLPPRLLRGTESAAVRDLEEMCATAEPFEVTMDGVESFVPVTPTVYIRVDSGSQHMHDLHQHLNSGVFQFDEQWPYHPHLTIVKLASDHLVPQAVEFSRRRWQLYRATRRILVDQLTFVREGENNCWVDLAPVPLGGRMASRPRP